MRVQSATDWLCKPVSAAPLAVFRIVFGATMLFGIIRFASYGWIHELYIAPEFYFPYYGFEWVRPLGSWTYALFAIMGVAALGILLGWHYRLASILFFLSFTYVELIDKTNYLNHYYFVSLVAFLLMFLPANRYFSMDAFQKRRAPAKEVPRWTIFILQVQLAIVYFYAGAAKLNSDWLMEALPLRIWLPPHTDMPIIGFMMDDLWVAYLFSWFGAFYDLTIPFFLWWNKTRPVAYLAVIIFHLLTWILFPIGIFPFVMIFSTLIFFSASFHEKLIQKISGLLSLPATQVSSTSIPARKGPLKWVALFVIIQLLVPWRYLLYPGNLFWTEEGYRFSWRVMLMEKAGHVIFHVTDPETKRTGDIYPGEYLTANQEKMMSTQPDMILQFAKYLEKEYEKKGIANPIITAEAYVTLNGQGSRLFIDPTTDLTRQEENFKHKSWILPYDSVTRFTSQP